MSSSEANIHAATEEPVYSSPSIYVLSHKKTIGIEEHEKINNEITMRPAT